MPKRSSKKSQVVSFYCDGCRQPRPMDSFDEKNQNVDHHHPRRCVSCSTGASNTAPLHNSLPTPLTAPLTSVATPATPASAPLSPSSPSNATSPDGEMIEKSDALPDGWQTTQPVGDNWTRQIFVCVPATYARVECYDTLSHSIISMVPLREFKNGCVWCTPPTMMATNHFIRAIRTEKKSRRFFGGSSSSESDEVYDDKHVLGAYPYIFRWNLPNLVEKDLRPTPCFVMTILDLPDVKRAHVLHCFIQQLHTERDSLRVYLNEHLRSLRSDTLYSGETIIIYAVLVMAAGNYNYNGDPDFLQLCSYVIKLRCAPFHSLLAPSSPWNVFLPQLQRFASIWAGANPYTWMQLPSWIKLYSIDPSLGWLAKISTSSLIGPSSSDIANWMSSLTSLAQYLQTPQSRHLLYDVLPVLVRTVPDLRSLIHLLLLDSFTMPPPTHHMVTTCGENVLRNFLNRVSELFNKSYPTIVLMGKLVDEHKGAGRSNEYLAHLVRVHLRQICERYHKSVDTWTTSEVNAIRSLLSTWVFPRSDDKERMVSCVINSCGATKSFVVSFLRDINKIAPTLLHHGMQFYLEVEANYHKRAKLTAMSLRDILEWYDSILKDLGLPSSQLPSLEQWMIDQLERTIGINQRSVYEATRMNAIMDSTLRVFRGLFAKLDEVEMKQQLATTSGAVSLIKLVANSADEKTSGTTVQLHLSSMAEEACCQVLTRIDRLCPESKDINSSMTASSSLEAQLLNARSLWLLFFGCTGQTAVLRNHKLYRDAVQVVHGLGKRMVTGDIALGEWRTLFQSSNGHPSSSLSDVYVIPDDVFELLQYRSWWTPLPNYILTKARINCLADYSSRITTTLDAIRYFLNTYCSKAIDYKESLAHLESIEKKLPTISLATIIDGYANPTVLWQQLSSIVSASIRLYSHRTSLLLGNMFRVLATPPDEKATVDTIVKTQVQQQVLDRLLDGAMKMFTKDAYKQLTVSDINALWAGINGLDEKTVDVELTHLRDLWFDKMLPIIDDTTKPLLNQFLTKTSGNKFIGYLLSLLRIFKVSQEGVLLGQLTAYQTGIQTPTMTLEQLGMISSAVEKLERSFTSDDAVAIEELSRASQLIEFITTNRTDDFTVLLDAVEEHSDNGLQENDISDLISCQSFLRPLLEQEWKLPDLFFEALAKRFVEFKQGRGGSTVTKPQEHAHISMKLHQCNERMVSIKHLWSNLANRGEVTREIIDSVIRNGHYTLNFQSGSTGRVELKYTVLKSQRTASSTYPTFTTVMRTLSLEQAVELKGRALLIMTSAEPKPVSVVTNVNEGDEDDKEDGEGGDDADEASLEAVVLGDGDDAEPINLAKSDNAVAAAEAPVSKNDDVPGNDATPSEIKETKVMTPVELSSTMRLKIFVDQINQLQELATIARQLCDSGHPDYATYDVKVNGNELSQHLADVSKPLAEWRRELDTIRQTSYYLNHLHAQQLRVVHEYFARAQPAEGDGEENGEGGSVDGDLASQDGDNASDEPDTALADVMDLLRCIHPRVTEAMVTQVHYVPHTGLAQRLQQLATSLDTIFTPLPPYVRPLPVPSTIDRDSHTQFMVASVTDSTGAVPVIMELYRNNGAMPEPSTLLMCRRSTSLEQLHNILLRCYGNGAPPHRHNNLYCIANIELLPLERMFQLCQWLQDDFLKRKPATSNGNDDGKENKRASTSGGYGRLALVVGSDQQHLLNTFASSVTPMSGLTTPEMVGLLPVGRKDVSVFTSHAPALGKTEAIKHAAFKVRRKLETFPITGEISVGALIRRLKDKQINPSWQALHLDIAQVPDPLALSSLLFELLAVGAISSGPYVMHDTGAITFIEVANTLASQLLRNLPLVHWFPNHHMVWSIDRLIVSNELRSPIQVVCHYLNVLPTINTQELDFGRESKLAPLPADRCRALLQQHFFTKSHTPNSAIAISSVKDNESFISLDTFLRVLSLQLVRFSESLYFTPKMLTTMVDAKEARTIRGLMVNALIDVAFEFATCSVGPVRSSQANEVEVEAMLQRVEGMTKWSESNHLILIFNARDSASFSSVYRDLTKVPPAVCNLLYAQHGRESKVPFVLPDYQTMTQASLLARLEIIARKSQAKRSYASYALTADNLTKMTLILMRMQSRVPVLVMGETGCGKTSLISFLAFAMDIPFMTKNIHAGITTQHIVDFINEVEAVAQTSNKPVWAFLDEINTSPYLGVISELLCSHSLFGRPIHRRVRFLGACNPYRRRAKSIDSVGLIGKVESNPLVYRVLPLPETLLGFVWDFGRLAKESELEYIATMVRSMISSNAANAKFLPYEALLVQLLSESQLFMQARDTCSVSLRDVKRALHLIQWFDRHDINNRPSAEKKLARSWPIDTCEIRSIVLALSVCYHCRLEGRDVRTEYRRKMASIFYAKNQSSITTERFELIIRDEQLDYLNRMHPLPPATAANEALLENVFVLIVCIVNRIPVFLVGKPGCSKSLSMSLIRSHLRGADSRDKWFQQLPHVYITAFQGSESSTSEGILKIFDKARSYMSPNSGALAVVLLDEVGLAEQSRHNPLKVLHSLLEPAMDREGKGADVPDVAVVGISNWSLDSAKMNRAIQLSRPDLDEKGLFETAKAIRDSITTSLQLPDNILEALAAGFFKYMTDSGVRKHFQHGLRDFYSMIKACAQSKSISPDQIVMCIARNFGGIPVNHIDPWTIFRKELRDRCLISDLATHQPVPARALLEANVRDPLARHLMLITTSDAALHTLVSILGHVKPASSIKVLYGSRLPEDNSEQYIYRVLSQIILCMEAGHTVILKDLELIYGALYDMLNQSYTRVGDTNNCRIAIGPYSNPMCRVHPDFRCIVLMGAHQVEVADPPFLNRFEKHVWNLDDQFTPSQRDTLNTLRRWTSQISNVTIDNGTSFTEYDMFAGYNENSLSSLVYLHSLKSNSVVDGHETKGEISTDVLLQCKGDLLSTACADGIARVGTPMISVPRLPAMLLSGDEYKHVMDTYRSQPHDNLRQFIRSVNTTTTVPAAASLSSSSVGARVYQHKFFVMTYSNINANITEDLTHGGFNVQVERLANFKSEASLDARCAKFFEAENKQQWLILQCDTSLKGDAASLMLAMHVMDNRYNEWFTNYITSNSEKVTETKAPVPSIPVRKYICIVQHVHRHSTTKQVKKKVMGQLDFLSGWSPILIDSIEYSSLTVSSIMDQSMVSLIQSDVYSFHTALEDSLLWSFFRIKYPVTNDSITERKANAVYVKECTNAIMAMSRSHLQQSPIGTSVNSSANPQSPRASHTFITILRDRVLQWLTKYVNQEANWQFHVARDRHALAVSNTFKAALLAAVRDRVRMPLAMLICQLEKSNALTGYIKSMPLSSSSPTAAAAVRNEIIQQSRLALLADDTVFVIGEMTKPQAAESFPVGQRYSLSYPAGRLLMDELDERFKSRYYQDKARLEATHNDSKANDGDSDGGEEVQATDQPTAEEPLTTNETTLRQSQMARFESLAQQLCSLLNKIRNSLTPASADPNDAVVHKDASDGGRSDNSVDSKRESKDPMSTSTTDLDLPPPMFVSEIVVRSSEITGKSAWVPSLVDYVRGLVQINMGLRDHQMDGVQWIITELVDFKLYESPIRAHIWWWDTCASDINLISAIRMVTTCTSILSVEQARKHVDQLFTATKKLRTRANFFELLCVAYCRAAIPVNSPVVAAKLNVDDWYRDVMKLLVYVNQVCPIEVQLPIVEVLRALTDFVVVVLQPNPFPEMKKSTTNQLLDMAAVVTPLIKESSFFESYVFIDGVTNIAARMITNVTEACQRQAMTPTKSQRLQSFHTSLTRFRASFYVRCLDGRDESNEEAVRPDTDDPFERKDIQGNTECLICTCAYTTIDGLQTPTIIGTCGHTFCYGCITSLPAKSVTGPNGTPVDVRTCPTCRKNGFQITMELPRNFGLIESIEKKLEEDKLAKRKSQTLYEYLVETLFSDRAPSPTLVPALLRILTSMSHTFDELLTAPLSELYDACPLLQVVDQHIIRAELRASHKSPFEQDSRMVTLCADIIQFATVGPEPMVAGFALDVLEASDNPQMIAAREIALVRIGAAQHILNEVASQSEPIAPYSPIRVAVATVVLRKFFFAVATPVVGPNNMPRPLQLHSSVIDTIKTMHESVRIYGLKRMRLSMPPAEIKKRIDDAKLEMLACGADWDDNMVMKKGLDIFASIPAVNDTISAVKLLIDTATLIKAHKMKRLLVELNNSSTSSSTDDRLRILAGIAQRLFLVRLSRVLSQPELVAVDAIMTSIEVTSLPAWLRRVVQYLCDGFHNSVSKVKFSPFQVDNLRAGLISGSSTNAHETLFFTHFVVTLASFQPESNPLSTIAFGDIDGKTVLPLSLNARLPTGSNVSAKDLFNSIHVRELYHTSDDQLSPVAYRIIHIFMYASWYCGYATQDKAQSPRFVDLLPQSTSSASSSSSSLSSATASVGKLVDLECLNQYRQGQQVLCHLLSCSPDVLATAMHAIITRFRDIMLTQPASLQGLTAQQWSLEFARLCIDPIVSQVHVSSFAHLSSLGTPVGERKEEKDGKSSDASAPAVAMRVIDLIDERVIDVKQRGPLARLFRCTLPRTFESFRGAFWSDPSIITAHPYIAAHFRHAHDFIQLQNLLPLVQWTKTMLARYRNVISRADAEKVKLSSLLTTPEMKTMFEAFQRAWNELLTPVRTRYPNEITIENSPFMSTDRYVADCLPVTKGSGMVLQRMLQYLVDIQRTIFEEAKKFADNGCRALSFFQHQQLTVSLQNLSGDHMLTDCLTNNAFVNSLMYCQPKLDYGHGYAMDCDFARIEADLAQRSLRNKPLIVPLTHELEFAFDIGAEARSIDQLLEEVNRLVPQVPLQPALATALNTSDIRHQAEQARSSLELLLQSVTSTGAPPDQEIRPYIAEWMGITAPLAKTALKVFGAYRMCNLVALYELFEDMNSTTLLGDVDAKYRSELNLHDGSHNGIVAALQTISSDIFLSALRRFMIRSLRRLAVDENEPLGSSRALGRATAWPIQAGSSSASSSSSSLSSYVQWVQALPPTLCARHTFATYQLVMQLQQQANDMAATHEHTWQMAMEQDAHHHHHVGSGLPTTNPLAAPSPSLSLAPVATPVASSSSTTGVVARTMAKKSAAARAGAAFRRQP